MNDVTPRWWEQRRVHVLLILCAAIPLLYPEIPPLIDLPGHMGRYAVELAQGAPGPLNQYYTFQWHLIGNLGADLLVVPLSKVFGLERAVKLIALAIPMVSTLGVLWISREAHGRVMPTTLLALPLIYGFPFIYGFFNYSLSMALVLNAFALWLRLGRLSRYRLRAGLFLAIAPIIWTAHAFGWAVLCLLCAGAELVHQYGQHKRLLLTVGHSILAGLPLAPPLLLMFLWRSGNVGGGTEGWFDWPQKWRWIIFVLRDRWLLLDDIEAALLYATGLGLICLIVARKVPIGISQRLAAGGLILAASYLVLPYTVFGSAFADMRLLPFALIILILAVRLQPDAGRSLGTKLAMIGLAPLVVRTGALTWSFIIAAHDYDRALGALDHLPVGAKLVSFARAGCDLNEGRSKLTHVSALAIVRRHAFSNDQWDLAGGQLLRSIYPRGTQADRYFGRDPSQLVTAKRCPGKIGPLSVAFASLPRDKFDYVWLIDLPVFDAHVARGLSLIWSDGPNALYRIDDHRPLDMIP
jgi:hypothetical protein